VTKIAPEPVIVPEPEPVAEPAVALAEPHPTPAPKPATQPATQPVTAAKPKPVDKEPEPVAADALPVPNYDELTLASVRARLRNLNVEQVSLLRDYERANATRADFNRMYENRIAKLNEQA
jgi:outer membrane biosynthesis protein TonB